MDHVVSLRDWMDHVVSLRDWMDHDLGCLTFSDWMDHLFGWPGTGQIMSLDASETVLETDHVFHCP